LILFADQVARGICFFAFSSFSDSFEKKKIGTKLLIETWGWGCPLHAGGIHSISPIYPISTMTNMFVFNWFFPEKWKKTCNHTQDLGNRSIRSWLKYTYSLKQISKIHLWMIRNTSEIVCPMSNLWYELEKPNHRLILKWELLTIFASMNMPVWISRFLK
jgi:hypothetical protein